MTVIEVLVPGGKATPSPPLGPTIGPTGVNIKEVIEKINEETKGFNGITVPVKINIDVKKNFTIEVGTPPTSALIKKELGIELGSEKPNEKFVGNLTMKQIVGIATNKKKDSLSKNLKNVCREVIGTCLSMGVTIEGMKAKQALQAIKDGKFDEFL